MPTTRRSLLIRIKDRRDADAWSEFYRLYAPLLYRYARSKGLGRQDAEEVRDECLEIITRKMPTFEYDKDKGGFKNFLYCLTAARVVDLLRKRRERTADIDELESIQATDPAPDEAWEQQWRWEHLKFCVEQVRSRVSDESHRVFQMLLFEECSIEEVCERLGMNPNRVYKIKSRMLQRVRNKMAELDPDLSI